MPRAPRPNPRVRATPVVELDVKENNDTADDLFERTHAITRTITFRKRGPRVVFQAGCSDSFETTLGDLKDAIRKLDGRSAS